MLYFRWTLRSMESLWTFRWNLGRLGKPSLWKNLKMMMRYVYDFTYGYPFLHVVVASASDVTHNKRFLLQWFLTLFNNYTFGYRMILSIFLPRCFLLQICCMWKRVKLVYWLYLFLLSNLHSIIKVDFMTKVSWFLCLLPAGTLNFFKLFESLNRIIVTILSNFLLLSLWFKNRLLWNV